MSAYFRGSIVLTGLEDEVRIPSFTVGECIMAISSPLTSNPNQTAWPSISPGQIGEIVSIKGEYIYIRFSNFKYKYKEESHIAEIHNASKFIKKTNGLSKATYYASKI